MSKKKPKWVETQFLDFEKEKEENKKLDNYAFSRKVNKMSPHEAVTQFINGKLSARRFVQSLFLGRKDVKSWASIANTMRSSPTRFDKFKSNWEKILLTVTKSSPNFIEDVENVNALTSIAEYLSESIRDIANWEPKRNNPKNQLHSLLRFLFCKYDVPNFLDQGFVNGDMEMIELFLHIGSGKSLKKFPLAPNLRLNNKVYHFILNSPEDVNYFQAFRRAQILSMGGDEQLCNSLMSSKLSDRSTEKQDDFWVTVIQFFINHPMVDPIKVSEIIDYINNQKYLHQRIINPNGRGFIFREAPHQSFSIKGRTMEALLRNSDEWHQQQINSIGRKDDPKKWEPVAIKDLTIKLHNEKVYVIIQLTTKSELAAEGSTMRHCVASYASSCSRGHTAIFSLRRVRDENHLTSYEEYLATIELRGNEIVQVKGKFNRPVDTLGWSIINRWIIDEGLRKSRYS